MSAVPSAQQAPTAVAKLIGSVGVIAGVFVALYKFVERDKRQSKLI